LDNDHKVQQSISTETETGPKQTYM